MTNRCLPLVQNRGFIRTLTELGSEEMRLRMTAICWKR